MTSLFDTDKPPESGAVISECGKYRYHLWRIWDVDKATLCFVMQNPSTADATANDPTIEKCLHFARRDGFGSISVRNVMAYRATDERELMKVADPFGPENWDHLRSARNVSMLTRLVVAWGVPFGGKRLHRHYVTAKSALLPQSPYCLGVTKDGHPKHPLFLKHSTEVIPFKPR